MEEREISNIYAIPANYTDSGKLFGGLLEVRNAVETGFLMMLLGYPELMLFSMPVRIRIVVMTLTLLPVAVLAMMGIDGDSLFQYISHMVKYMIHKRKLHFRRIGYRYEQSDSGRKKKESRQEKEGRDRTKGKQTAEGKRQENDISTKRKAPDRPKAERRQGAEGSRYATPPGKRTQSGRKPLKASSGRKKKSERYAYEGR